jgi:hypothetical protein
MSIGVTSQHVGWIKSIEFNEFLIEGSTGAAVDILSPPRLFSLS